MQVAAADELTADAIRDVSQSRTAVVSRCDDESTVNRRRTMPKSTKTVAMTAATRPYNPRGVPNPIWWRKTSTPSPSQPLTVSIIWAMPPLIPSPPRRPIPPPPSRAAPSFTAPAPVYTSALRRSNRRSCRTHVSSPLPDGRARAARASAVTVVYPETCDLGQWSCRDFSSQEHVHIRFLGPAQLHA